MSAEDEYPGLRTALRSDAAINLYCGLKWLCWQLFHVLFITFAFVAVVVVGTLMVAYNALAITGNWVVHYLDRFYVDHLRGRVQASERTGRVLDRIDRAHETSTRTPVLRRLYGYCPVDIKADTRWSAAITSRGERLAERAERFMENLNPPERVWVCQTCGRIEEYEWATSFCRDCFGEDTYKPYYTDELPVEDDEGLAEVFDGP